MVAAYSYMALVPIVQPPVIRLLTTQKERRIRMSYEKGSVSQLTKILFPIEMCIRDRYHNIHVVYTREAETADMFIERATHELAKNHRVRVVSSDGAEQIIILGNGALRVSARAFEREVRAVEAEIREFLDQ